MPRLAFAYPVLGEGREGVVTRRDVITRIVLTAVIDHLTSDCRYLRVDLASRRKGGGRRGGSFLMIDRLPRGCRTKADPLSFNLENKLGYCIKADPLSASVFLPQNRFQIHDTRVSTKHIPGTPE